MVREVIPSISLNLQQDDCIRDVASQLGFLNYVTVPPRGLSGGLAIFWFQHVQLSVLSSSPNFIDCKISCNGNILYFSLVYGHPNSTFRSHTWERIERVGLNWKMELWMLVGDFNELLGNHEKIGGSIRPENSFEEPWSTTTIFRILKRLVIDSLGLVCVELII